MSDISESENLQKGKLLRILGVGFGIAVVMLGGGFAPRHLSRCAAIC